MEPPENKKPRLESSFTEGATSSCNGTPSKDRDQDPPFPFNEFQAQKVLFTDPRTKSICVLGSLGELEQQGIILAEKQPLTESSLPHLTSCVAEKKFQNDVYSQYILNSGEGGLGEMRVTTIYPATEAHVKKYQAQRCRVILEDPGAYQSITKPFAEKQSLSLDVSVETL